jgi:hypothetical protein
MTLLFSIQILGFLIARKSVCRSTHLPDAKGPAAGEIIRIGPPLTKKEFAIRREPLDVARVEITERLCRT